MDERFFSPYWKEKYNEGRTTAVALGILAKRHPDESDDDIICRVIVKLLET